MTLAIHPTHGWIDSPGSRSLDANLSPVRRPTTHSEFCRRRLSISTGLVAVTLAAAAAIGVLSAPATANTTNLGQCTTNGIYNPACRAIPGHPDGWYSPTTAPVASLPSPVQARAI